MATNPLTGPKFQAFDDAGDPLSGGKLYTYAAGTTTPLATYTTRAGNVANTNPVILDANGEANVWLAPGVDYKFLLTDNLSGMRWTVDNYPSAGAATTDTTLDVSTDPGGRLSLVSDNSTPSYDVTGATTVHYSVYKHNKVPLFDGTNWALSILTGDLSQTTSDNTKSPAAVANNCNYDLFIWDDAGTLRLSRGPAWSSDTARGSGAGTAEVTRQDGRVVNAVSISNGPGASRGLYVGTIRSDGSAHINDSLAKRHVWNCYHRILRPMVVKETTDSWTYATATLRQANANTANQLDYVAGLDEDAVVARVIACGYATTNTHGALVVAIGLDSTSAAASQSTQGVAEAQIGHGDNPVLTVMATYSGASGSGRHYLAWLEYVSAAFDVTIHGDTGGTYPVQSGISGEMWG